jgi:superfamily II DNA or RNA helicase
VFAPGQRVRLRATGELGYVMRVRTTLDGPTYSVGFPSGEWDVREFAIEAHASDAPFQVLTKNRSGYPYDCWLRREAHRLIDAYRNDPLAVLSNSRVEPKPHQVSVLMRVMEKPRSRMILADEVGLGKTIEAGLILKELRARGAADRVLVLTPASLQTQWEYELRTKFNEQFRILDGSYLRNLVTNRPEQNPFSFHPHAICSINLARGEPWRDHLVEAEWDLVIVDEAHHARYKWNNGRPEMTQLYELVEELRDRVTGLLLLTATPMQLHPFELFAMTTLVEPGLFEDLGDFERHRADIARINHHVAELTDGPPSAGSKSDLYQLLVRLKAPVELLTARLDDPVQREHLAQWLAKQHRLSEVLIRNRKKAVGGFLERRATRILVRASEPEIQLERDVSNYIQHRYRSLGRHGRSAAGLVLVVFQKLLCSSSWALRQALENRRHRLKGTFDETTLSDDPDVNADVEAAERDEVEATDELRLLDHLIAQARGVVDSKADALEQTLMGLFQEYPDEKVVVFSQYLQTIAMLERRLSKSLRVAVFHGKLDLREKDEAVRQFRYGGQVLLTSEAGGEGRNFQFCHILFNYDLPWNPMRIEQRIGRIDRIGQQRNVLIYNFALAGALDERILDVLDTRIRVFSESVGALDPILGQVEEDLMRLCLQDVQKAKHDIARYEVELGRKVDRARTLEANLRDLVMDTRSFRRNEVAALLNKGPSASPQEVATFVTTFLRRAPKGGAEHRSGLTFKLTVPPVIRIKHKELEETYVGTFDFREALADERLDFFAFGHPLVEVAVLDATQEQFAGTPGVLSMVGRQDRAALACYELRFFGVEERTQLYEHVVSSEGVSPALRSDAPQDPDAVVDFGGWSQEAVDAAEQMSRAAADEHARQHFELFSATNQKLYEESLLRLEKRFAAQRKSFQERIDRNEQLIRDAAVLGLSATSVSARRGVVTRNRRSLAELALEEGRARSQLALRKDPVVNTRLAALFEIWGEPPLPSA